MPHADDTAAGPAPTPGGGYLAGWDGVRAVAIIAVVVFHLSPDALPGGFLGVSVFFVLAGALATLRIDREIGRTGGFAVGAYAGGRVRRLLPALLVYVAAVLIWIWIDSPSLFATTAGDAVAALLYVTPWREMTEPTGYAGAFAVGPEPLLHTWSLGVEEAAWILTGITVAATRTVWSAAAATAVVGVVGYVVWFGDPDLYYSPARLLEFALGAGLGVALARGHRPFGWRSGLLGIAVLAVLMADTGVAEVYEGRLLVAALASVLVIGAATTGPFDRVLSTAPLRWVGTRSYSLYLWHVGLIELTELSDAGVVVVSALLAEISYRLVENPFRHRRVLARRAAPALLATTAVAVAVVGWGPRPATDDELDVAASALAASTFPRQSATDNDPAEPDQLPTDADIGDEADEPDAACGDCVASPIAGAAPYGPQSVFTDLDDPVRIAVIGDSTGVYLAIALAAWGELTGEAIVEDLTVGGCSPLSFDGSGWYRTRIRVDDPGETERAGCLPTVDDVADETDLIVVVATGTPLLDHLSPDGEWVGLDHPAAIEVLSAYYANERAAAGRRGVPIVAATGATMPQSTIVALRDPTRTEALNRVLLASGITTYDLTTPLETDDYLRFDGTHLHVDTVLPFDGPERNEGHRYVADVMGPALVAHARSLDAGG